MDEGVEDMIRIGDATDYLSNGSNECYHRRERGVVVVVVVAIIFDVSRCRRKSFSQY